MTDSVNCSALAESMRRAMCDMLVSAADMGRGYDTRNRTSPKRMGRRKNTEPRVKNPGVPGLPYQGGPIVAWVRFRPKLRNTGRESLKDLAGRRPRNRWVKAYLACGSGRRRLKRGRRKQV